MTEERSFEEALEERRAWALKHLHATHRPVDVGEHHVARATDYPEPAGPAKPGLREKLAHIDLEAELLREPYRGPHGARPSMTHAEFARQQAGLKGIEPDTALFSDCPGVLEIRAFRPLTDREDPEWFGDSLHRNIYCSVCSGGCVPDSPISSHPTDYKAALLAERRQEKAEAVGGRGATPAPDW